MNKKPFKRGSCHWKRKGRSEPSLPSPSLSAVQLRRLGGGSRSLRVFFNQPRRLCNLSQHTAKGFQATGLSSEKHCAFYQIISVVYSKGLIIRIYNVKHRPLSSQKLKFKHNKVDRKYSVTLSLDLGTHSPTQLYSQQSTTFCPIHKSSSAHTDTGNTCIPKFII